MKQLLGTALLLVGMMVSWSAARAGMSDRLPPAAYIDPVDQQIAKTGKGVAGRPFPCSREKDEHGISVVESLPTDRCVKMLSAQRWRGLWRNDFEGSQFCPAPAKLCPSNAAADRIWLTAGPLRGSRGAVYAVEFVGRLTAYKGHYGHLGMSDHEIVVDEVSSIRLVKAPPAPMTKAEFIAQMRACEAAGTCIPSEEAKAIMNGSK